MDEEEEVCAPVLYWFWVEVPDDDPVEVEIDEPDEEPEEPDEPVEEEPEVLEPDEPLDPVTVLLDPLPLVVNPELLELPDPNWLIDPDEEPPLVEEELWTVVPEAEVWEEDVWRGWLFVISTHFPLSWVYPDAHGMHWPWARR